MFLAELLVEVGMSVSPPTVPVPEKDADYRHGPTRKSYFDRWGVWEYYERLKRWCHEHGYDDKESNEIAYRMADSAAKKFERGCEMVDLETMPQLKVKGGVASRRPQMNARDARRKADAVLKKDSVSDPPRKMTFGEEVRWVLDHLDREGIGPHDAPSRGAYTMLLDARKPKGRDKFMQNFVVKLLGAEHSKVERKKTDVDDGRLLLQLERLLEEQRLLEGMR
jgi:hypothetical protein